MRIFAITLITGLMVLSVALAGDTEKPWFDLENCVFCKELGAETAAHMKTEYHNLSNGVLSVTIVEKDYLDEYKAAQEGMQKVAEDMFKSGEKPYMCGHCSAYGEFMQAGVKMEHVRSEAGEIHLMTSADPEMVEKLQAFGKRSAEALEKWRSTSEE